MTDTATETNELATVAKREGVELAVATPIINAFLPSFEAAQKLVEETRGITVEDAADVDGMEAADKARKRLAKVRTGSNAVREEQKAVYLRMGRAVDGIHKRILAIVEPEEKRLKDAAETAERIQSERRAKRKAAREEALAPFGVDTAFIDLNMMPEPAFQQLLANSKLTFEAKIAAAAKAEADRLAAEKARAEEESRVRAENERLKQEAEEAARVAAEAARRAEEERKAIEAAHAEERRKREEAAEAALAEERRKAAEAAAKARAEREALEAQARAEREAAAEASRKERERVEAERKAEADRIRAEWAAQEKKRLAEAKAAAEKARIEREAAEAAARKEREAREKVEAELAAKRAEEERRLAEEKRLAEERAAAVELAARASDDDKLRTLAETLRAFPMPEVTSKGAEAVIKKTRAFLETVAGKIEEAIK